MAQTIKLKRSSTQSAVPTTAQLVLGEVAINTYDGKMYIKKDDGNTSIVELGSSGMGSANPTFTGILTVPNINVTTALQFGGVALTSTVIELNKLDGVTATTAELNYVDGVTSNIQTQINTKGTVSSLSDLSITSTAAELNKLDGVTTTTAELNYVSGVTSNIQTQLTAAVNPSLISKVEAEAGTDVTERTFSALRVKQAITALASAGDSGIAMAIALGG